MTIKEVEDKIKRLRLEKGMSSKELSLGIGEKETYIDQVEDCSLLPNLPTMLKICDYLGVESYDFFNEENKKDTLIPLITQELYKYDIKELLKIYYLIKQ